MQRPLSPVFGRALPSELGAGMLQRGQKSRARAAPAMGDPIDEPVKEVIPERIEVPPGSDGPLRIAERINKHLDSLEKSVESALKKINNLQHHLRPIMDEHPDSKKAVSQMLVGFNKKISALTDQLRSVTFDAEGNVPESRPSEIVQVRADASPIRPVRRMCSSPVRKLQSWRL